MAYTIPAARTYDWAGNCGIPGGIPTRETIYQTMTSANTAAQINTAIAGCTSGQVVYLSAGTYNIGQINFALKSNVTLRGAGPGETIIVSSASQAIVNGGYTYAEANGIALLAIASGGTHTKGSKVITLASAPSANMVAGNIIGITQDNSVDTFASGVGVYRRVAGTGAVYNMSSSRCLQFFSRIVSVAGNAITIATELPWTYTDSLNPKAYPASGSGVTSLCGVENLTIDCNDSGDRAIYFLNADRCWFKDIEVKGCIGTTGQISLWNCVQNEVRRCYIHDTPSYPTQSDAYGVMLYYGTSNTLCVDNIFDQTGPAFMLNGAAANAVIFNYIYRLGRASLTWQTDGIISNHGPHCIMNLYEGNYTNKFNNDAYHGSASHETLFRNHISGYDPDGKTMERRLVNLCKGSYYENVVGNVIGHSSYEPTEYQCSSSAAHDGSYCYVLGWAESATAVPTTDTVPWEGWTASFPDANVAATIIRHGNYDYKTDSQYAWADADHDISDSLFYSSKPSWFGSLTWPPIDPVTPTLSASPSKWRWDQFLVSGLLSDLFIDSGVVTGFETTEAVRLIVDADEQAKLYVDRAKRRAVAGTSVVYSVHAEPFNGFTGNITLDVTGLPTNATDSYGTNPITETGSSLVTITTTGVAVGSHVMYITGTSAGGDVASVRVVLEIVASADADIKVPFRYIRAKQGDNAVYTIEAEAQGGYVGDVDLSVSGTPSGASAAFGDATIAYNGSTTLTIDTGTAAVGTYDLIITGEGPA